LSFRSPKNDADCRLVGPMRLASGHAMLLPCVQYCGAQVSASCSQRDPIGSSMSSPRWKSMHPPAAGALQASSRGRSIVNE
jgi:hypothetical protein